MAALARERTVREEGEVVIGEDATASRETLRRLSQVAAVTSGSRVEDTIDWLIPMLAYYSPGPWSTTDDWFDEIKTAYGVEVPLHDIGDSIARLRKQGTLVWDTFQSEFHLSETAKSKIEERIEAAGDLEDEVARFWAQSLPHSLREMYGDRKGWQILMNYCAEVFRQHGVDAVQVLTAEVSRDPSVTQTRLLTEILDANNITGEERAPLRAAIASFFQSSEPAVTAYVSQLADSTFNLLALCVDEATRRDLRLAMPPLKIFVDTNILFSLMGTHDTPLAAASLDLVRVIKQASLPFTLYYHAKTLAELTHSIEIATDRLKRQTWSSRVSRAVVSLPWYHTKVSGIEMRFHRLNAERQIDPAAFCARFHSPAGLLAQHGLKIYREPDTAEPQERMQLKSTVIADYAEYLDKIPRRRNSHYSKLDHDATVWMLAKEQQSHNKKGALFAGSFFLSSDYALWRFDSQVMRRNYGSRPVVVLPDSLLQSLRPFVGGVEFDDKAFVQAFTAAEFRAGGGTDLAATVQRVVSYLATFEDLPEETATRLLTDTILLEGLKRYEEGAPEFSEAIEKAIFAHNETLVRERDELLVEREEQLGRAERALHEATTEGTDPLSVLEKFVSTLREADKSRHPVIIHNHNGGTVNTDSGGTYHNEGTQVGAQGPGASATGNNQTMHFNKVSADPALIKELIEVKSRLLSAAKSSADYEVVASTQGAIEALEQNDGEKAGGLLRQAGRKALDAAIEIGAKLASSALQQQLGVGG